MRDVRRSSPVTAAGVVLLSGALVTLLLAWAAASAHRENEARLNHINAVAPTPVTNAIYTKTLAGVLGRAVGWYEAGEGAGLIVAAVAGSEVVKRRSGSIQPDPDVTSIRL